MTEGFVENTVENFNDQQFKTFFGLSRAAVEAFTHCIAANLEFVSSVFLRFSVCQDSLEPLGLVFGFPKSTVSRIITRVLTAMANSSFKKDQVSLPCVNQCEQEGIIFQQQSQNFFDASIFGAIDSKEVRIKRPILDSEAYYNRKGFHSVKLQIVCSSSTKIFDYFVGWPGSSNDAYAF
jgi:hypothetical protein